MLRYVEIAFCHWVSLGLLFLLMSLDVLGKPSFFEADCQVLLDTEQVYIGYGFFQPLGNTEEDKENYNSTENQRNAE